MPATLPSRSIPLAEDSADRPELACVVLAVGNPPSLLHAIRSLSGQSDRVEIVVVNSGGGGAASTLASDHPAVRAVEFEERLLPGAARNRGIAATTAPLISFLAADCVAEPGWVEARLAAHRAGAVAVASSVTNPFRRNLAAWVSYVALFNTRMPGTQPAEAALYGVSYARHLFERHGLFREELRGGEDTEFHQRLRDAGVAIAWHPEVRTAHRHPTRFVEMLADQFRRGARTARTWQRLGGPTPARVAINAIRRVPASARLARRAASQGERTWVLAAVMLLPVAAFAYAAGSIAHALTGRGTEEE